MIDTPNEMLSDLKIDCKSLLVGRKIHSCYLIIISRLFGLITINTLLLLLLLYVRSLFKVVSWAATMKK